MKLFLCSDLITPNLKPEFESFIGKKCEGLKAIFIPTGSNPLSDKSGREVDRLHLVNDLKFEIETIDIEEVHGEELKNKIIGADILWMNGGFTAYLMKWVKKSGLEQFLPELLESGIIFVGSSSGSMICSKNFEIAHWFIGEAEPKYAEPHGLGYINFQIYPHYREELLEEIKEHKDPKEQYFLLKEDQAVSYDDGVIKFYGGNITMLDRSE